MKNALVKLKSKEATLVGILTARGWKAGTIASGNFCKENLISEQVFKNKVMKSDTYGVNLLLRQMMGDDTYPIVIDGAGIGTGVTPPTAEDTALENEIVGDIAITDMNIVDGDLVIDIFIPNADLPNNEYTEFGLKMDTRLFTHAAFYYNKGSNQDTTIEYTVIMNV